MTPVSSFLSSEFGKSIQSWFLTLRAIFQPSRAILVWDASDTWLITWCSVSDLPSRWLKIQSTFTICELRCFTSSKSRGLIMNPSIPAASALSTTCASPLAEQQTMWGRSSGVSSRLLETSRLISFAIAGPSILGIKYSSRMSLYILALPCVTYLIRFVTKSMAVVPSIAESLF